ncbi:MAG TPA: SCP2 sterol-binding domain-containing protein [Stackebrandtia sp.]|jgi:putative sterol carrier protein|uniref:SCP2 sterol-binding domain-containing protein n=1 Tax=Stackebrandtia sp. TaxID=2023065 RepID=UPI002D5A71D3|nr:SCP2 sterol-binding domain-containing protein [Stackebrandtia sp.]HZE38136.1 SCP2 sterol-binding domain-containing protein [Stackebrandtia sp.]
MATAEECRNALEKLAAQIAENAEQVKSKMNFERTLACDVTDLGVSFCGKFSGGTLIDIVEGGNPNAEIRMTVGSDDLVSLINGDLDFGPAFASGRVKLKASIMDLLKLKSML